MPDPETARRIPRLASGFLTAFTAAALALALLGAAGRGVPGPRVPIASASTLAQRTATPMPTAAPALTLTRRFSLDAAAPAAEFGQPAGIAVGAAGDMWVIDAGQHRAVKLSPGGDVLAVIGGRGSAEGRFAAPLGIAVAPNGDVYIADTGNARVQRFAPDGRFLLAWGGRGQACNRFDVRYSSDRGPTDVEVGPDGLVYVVDDGVFGRILVFTPDGACVRGWRLDEEGLDVRRGAIATGFDAPRPEPIALSLFAPPRTEDLRLFAPPRTAGAFARFGPTAPVSSYRFMPFKMAVDPVDGSVVVAFGEGRMRRYTSKGYFLNSIGGIGVSPGRFAGPGVGGLGIGADGTLWVADSYFQRVQRFRLEGGFLDWFATPFGLATDVEPGPDDTLLVAATAREQPARLVRVSPEGQTLGFWGSDAADFAHADGPHAVAITPGGEVVTADRAHDRLQRYGADGAFLGTWGGPGRAPGRLANPGGMAFLSDGRLYAADTYNHRVVIFDAQGRPLGAAGEYGRGNGQFNRPGDLAVIESVSPGRAGGNAVRRKIYVADTGNDRVVLLSSSGAFETASYAPSDGYELKTPAGIAAYSMTLFIADTGNHRIVRIKDYLEQERMWGEGGNGPGQFKSPMDVAVGPDRTVYVADTGNNRIQRFTWDGDFVAAWGGYGTADGQFDAPVSVAVDADGSVVVADRGNRRVQRFTADGRHVASWATIGWREGLLGNSTVYAGSDPATVASGPDGALYTGSWRESSAQRFDTAGTFEARLRMPGAAEGQTRDPSAIDVGPDGVAYAVDANNYRVERFGPDGRSLGGWDAPGSKQYDRPRDVAVAPDRSVSLIFGDPVRVEQHAPTGARLNQWGIPGQGPGYQLPAAIDFGPDGSLYVADEYAKSVERYDVAGRRLAKWTVRAKTDYGPTGLAVAPDGSVYVGTEVDLRHYAADGASYRTVSLPGACGGPLTDLDDYGQARALDVRPDGTLVVGWKRYGCADVLAGAPDPNWRVEVFGNPLLAERPAVVRAMQSLDFDGAAAFAAAAVPSAPKSRFVPPAGFSARAERTIRVDTPTRIDFDARVTGGVRLWVGDRIWIDDWHATTPVTTTLDVTVGVGDHRLVVEFRDTGPVPALHVDLSLAPAGAPPTATPTLRVPTATPTATATASPTESASPTATATRTRRPPTATPEWLAVILYVPVAGRGWVRGGVVPGGGAYPLPGLTGRASERPVKPAPLPLGMGEGRIAGLSAGEPPVRVRPRKAIST